MGGPTAFAKATASPPKLQRRRRPCLRISETTQLHDSRHLRKGRLLL
jgi:hypothetical protein